MDHGAEVRATVIVGGHVQWIGQPSCVTAEGMELDGLGVGFPIGTPCVVRLEVAHPDRPLTVHALAHVGPHPDEVRFELFLGHRGRERLRRALAEAAAGEPVATRSA